MRAAPPRANPKLRAGENEMYIYIYFFIPAYVLSLSLSLAEFLSSPSCALDVLALFRPFFPSISARRSPSPAARSSRRGILKPPCRNKAGLWPTRGLASRATASPPENIMSQHGTYAVSPNPPPLLLHLSSSSSPSPRTHPSIAFTMPPGCINKIFLLRHETEYTRGGERKRTGAKCKWQVEMHRLRQVIASLPRARSIHPPLTLANALFFISLADTRYIPFYAVLYTVYVYPTYLRRRRRRRWLLKSQPYRLLVYIEIQRLRRIKAITANLVTM